MKKTIRTVAELRSLKKFGNRRGLRDVEIDLSGSSAETRKQEARINKSLKTCGCELGAAFAAAGLVATAAAVFWEPSLDVWNASRIALAALVLFGFALTGKVLGLVIADRKLRMAIDAIDRDISRCPKRPLLVSRDDLTGQRIS